MPGLERHEDLAVQRPDGAGVAVREVDAAVGYAQVVEDRLELGGRDELADLGLHAVGDEGGLLDARAGGSAHVQADLAGVHAGEEVPAHERQ